MSELNELKVNPVNRSPRIFTKLMEANSRFVMRKPEVQGIENISLGVVPLIVTSHLSDIDVQAVAGVAGQHRDVAVASQQTNQADALMSKIQIAAGRDRFLDVDNAIQDGKVSYFFNPDNYRSMAETIKNGKTVVIAAHQPVYDKKLPDRPGIGAAYLAQLTDERTLIPATVVTDAQEPVGISTRIGDTVKRMIQGKRPSSKIVFGAPVQLEKIDEADLQLAAAIFKSELRRTLTFEQKVNAMEIVRKLEKQSAVIMEALAVPLPPKEQGIWGKK